MDSGASAFNSFLTRGDTAQLVRITYAFFGHSCNKYLILMGRFVTDVLSVKTEDSNEFDYPHIL